MITKRRVRQSSGSYRILPWEPYVNIVYDDLDEELVSEFPRHIGDGYFYVNRFKMRGSVANGGPDVNGWYHYINTKSGARNNLRFSDFPFPADMPTREDMALKLIKDSNPNQPHVDVPGFLAELREFPKLVNRGTKEIVDHFKNLRVSKGLASANLASQFGWNPLIGDLVKLVRFQDAVDQRIKFLDSVRDNGFVKVKRTLYKGATQASFVSPEGIPVWYGRTVKMSGYVSWYTDFLLPSDGSSMRKLAWRAIHGLNGVSLSTAWNLMPWSWLIDWFSNVGDILESQRNDIPFQHTSPRIMTHMKAQGHHEQFQAGIHKISEGVFTHEQKSRHVTPLPGIQAQLPFLTNGQFSILASLALLRRKR